MGQVSLKTAFFTIFVAGCVLCLGGCIEPVDLSAFVNDEEVQDIFGNGTETVSLDPASDPGLIPGNKKITGLSSGKYYMVEEWAANGDPLGVRFVSANGTRSVNLTGIGKVSGGAITGLTNRHTYLVKSAAALTGNVFYSYYSGGTYSAAIIGGVVTIQPPYGDYFIFNPASVLPPTVSNVDIVNIPITPAGPKEQVPASGTIITPAAGGKETDYVFYDKLAKALYVLRVVFAEDDGGEGVSLLPTFNIGADESPVLEWASSAAGPWAAVPAKPGKLSQTSGVTLYLRVKDATPNYTDIKWYCNSAAAFATGDTYNGTLGTTAPFTSTKTYDLLVIGTWTDGKPYGTTVFIQVDD